MSIIHFTPRLPLYQERLELRWQQLNAVCSLAKGLDYSSLTPRCFTILVPGWPG